MRVILWFSVIALLFAFAGQNERDFVREDKLSSYKFFVGDLAALEPAPEVIPYDVNNSLFSNYAEKKRFIKIPEGSKIIYDDTVVFSFPPGSVLIKNFFYPVDARKPNKGRRILETRLLVHEKSGWQAYPYIWNEEQTEAYYDPAGETRSVSYIDLAGQKIKSNYVIPNKNQCKGCHAQGNTMLPIGLSARQLNRDYEYPSERSNQLAYLYRLGILDTLPKQIPKMAVWDATLSGSVNERARAYLDANCGHCHSKNGPANTSGLHLDYYEKDNQHLGVNKTPVAAGRGAGDLQFDIVPGDPAESILVYRMKTNDPAIAMPEIGREQVHEEGVALIEKWIREHDFKANSND